MRKQNGLVPNFDDQGKRKITVTREQFFTGYFIGTRTGIKTTTDHQLNENGDVTIALDIAKNELKCSLQVRTDNS